jgi:hypothetical protein
VYTFTDEYAEARAQRDLALTWFLSFTKENGLFEYELDPKTGKYSTQNNELRQVMASRLLAEVAANDSTYLAQHQKNLDFIFRHWYKEENGIGYIDFYDKSKLGANAMLLRTLVASPLYEQYAKEARALANGILATRDGAAFNAWYKEPSYKYDEDYLLTFYSGEALLALMEYFDMTGDRVLLAETVKTADYYFDKYVPNLDTNYYPAYVPWITLAFEKLYATTGDTKYREAIFTLNDKLLELQDTTEYVGRFYNSSTPQYGTPHSSTDAVYTEGLIHAFTVATAAGDRARERVYHQAIVRSLSNTHSLQYQSPVTGFVADPKTYVGALRQNAGTNSVRIDCAQHLIDGLNTFLEETP